MGFYQTWTRCSGVRWTVLSGIVYPLARGLWLVVLGPGLHQHRLRAVLVTGAAIACVALLLFGVELPYGTVTQGVVWAPAGSDLRAGAEGTMTRLIAAPGASLAPGDHVARVDGRIARFVLERGDERLGGGRIGGAREDGRAKRGGDEGTACAWDAGAERAHALSVGSRRALRTEPRHMSRRACAPELRVSARGTTRSCAASPPRARSAAPSR